MAIGAGELGGEPDDGIDCGTVGNDAVYAVLLPAVQQLLPADKPGGDIFGDGDYDAGVCVADGRMDTGGWRSIRLCNKVAGVGTEHGCRMD